MRAFGIFFGLLFLFLGIAGFIPIFISHHLLFSVFRVSIALNIIYLILGFIGVAVGIWHAKASRFYFQIIGIVLALLALFGFIYGDKEILYTIVSNQANTWLHVVLAVAALILGYGGKD